MNIRNKGDPIVDGVNKPGEGAQEGEPSMQPTFRALNVAMSA